MISIYTSGLAPRLKATINAPRLNDDQAKTFVRALIKSAAAQVVSDDWIWRKYRTQDGRQWFDDQDKRHFWAKASPELRTACINKAGDAIYSELVSLTGANPNVLKGADVITVEATRDAVRAAIDREIDLYETGNVPKPEPAPEPEVGKALDTALPAYHRGVTMTMRKALGIAEPDLTKFVPNDAVAMDLYRKKGIVPEGYLDRRQIEMLSPAYAREMEKGRVPMLSREYFEQDVTQRVLVDMVKSEESWRNFFNNFVPVDDTALEKGHTSEETLADRLGDLDNIDPTTLLKSLAHAFFDLEMDDRDKIVKGFSSDSAAVVAAISLASLDDQPGLYKGQLKKERLALVTVGTSKAGTPIRRWKKMGGMSVWQKLKHRVSGGEVKDASGKKSGGKKKPLSEGQAKLGEKKSPKTPKGGVPKIGAGSADAHFAKVKTLSGANKKLKTKLEELSRSDKEGRKALNDAYKRAVERIGKGSEKGKPAGEKKEKPSGKKEKPSGKKEKPSDEYAGHVPKHVGDDEDAHAVHIERESKLVSSLEKMKHGSTADHTYMPGNKTSVTRHGDDHFEVDGKSHTLDSTVGYIAKHQSKAGYGGRNAKKSIGDLAEQADALVKGL